MQLIHYSAAPIGPLASIEQQPVPEAYYSKPDGLWVSVGEEWRVWCEDNDFALGSLALAYDVTLAPSASLLVLCDAVALDNFTEIFGVDTASARPSRLFDMRAIDWRQVARCYQGIVIAPYVQARRLTLMWYYCWDCASGCIWDVRAIAAITPRPR